MINFSLGGEEMRAAAVLFLVMSIVSGGLSQKAIKNPAKPESKKAGRILELKEEIRISDEQGGFYFKNPENIGVSPDGSLFVVDGDQFLKFDSKGKFVKNLFRKGEGPGEFQSIDNYLFAGNEVIVHQSLPNKIVRMDSEGNLIRELRLEKAASRLFAIFNDKFIMGRNSFPVLKREGTEPETVDIDWSLLLVSEDGKVEETGQIFPAKWFARRLPNAIIANNITDLCCTPYERKYLIIHHTQDYLLKMLDLEKKQIIRTFKRKYKSVKRRPGKERIKEAEPYQYTLEPPTDYYNDIQRVFIHQDNIWVLTSTRDEKKGILVDVFNGEGQYVDNFYLPLSKKIKQDDLMKWPLTISGDSLLVVETDVNEVPNVVEYKIKT
jgi:hypothetical protein